MDYPHSGLYPVCMETAANDIEDLANNALGKYPSWMCLRQIPKKDSTRTNRFRSFYIKPTKFLPQVSPQS